MYLQHLSITGFRGVDEQLDFPMAHRTIFFGPNGSGKSSVLQAIAWALYGKLPQFSSGVFSKEDALVNDFSERSQAEVVVRLTDNVSVQRKRIKRDSTGAGVAPPILSLPADDPQSEIEQLLGLNMDEFFAAVFLHQETIRDFLTTTPEKRSATVDRMIGTYLLRTLIKSVDPRVPDKSIREVQDALQAIDDRLLEASVLNREMILNKRAQYGDPAELPRLLTDILAELTPTLSDLGLPIPDPTLEDLRLALGSARRTQLERANALTKRASELDALRQRLDRAIDADWHHVRQKKVQLGGIDDLSGLVEVVRQSLALICSKFSMPEPGTALSDLQETLSVVQRAQPNEISRLEQQIARVRSLQARYHQMAVVDWQAIAERKAQWGDPSTLHILLGDIKDELDPVLLSLDLPLSKPDLSSLEGSLVRISRALPVVVGRLERKSAEHLALKDRYLQLSQEIVEDLTMPPELLARQGELQSSMDHLSREIADLHRQLSELKATQERAEVIRIRIQALPQLLAEVDALRADLENLDIASKNTTLYNQVLDVGRKYLDQVKPDTCPVCKQAIGDLASLLEMMNAEVPTDIVTLGRQYDALSEQLGLKETSILRLKDDQRQLIALEAKISEYPLDLETEIANQQRANEQIADELARVQAQIVGIESRIQMIVQTRNRLRSIEGEIEAALGRATEGPWPMALEQAALDAREEAARLESLDLQPISDQIVVARELNAIYEDERDLNQRLKVAQSEIAEIVGDFSDEEMSVEIETALANLITRVGEIRELDFRPVVDGLSRIRQIQSIRDEEDRLQIALQTVQVQARETLALPSKEADLLLALESEISDVRYRAQTVSEIDFEAIESKLGNASQLEAIRNDEIQLSSLESNNQAANREKARLKHQIRQLSELREALLDIAETTKRHQETILMDVLSNLDVRRYYQHLNPHPVYTDLQIEPELTSKGTYNYWIKAVTADFSRDTHVQTRFSTAQANSAAIALFLAVNQHLSRKLQTMVLDDPSQSMDAEHKRHLAETLAASSRQVIVATEDPEMFGYLRDSFDAPKIYELSPWTVRGTRLSAE